MDFFSNIVEACLTFYLLSHALPPDCGKWRRQVVGMLLLILYITLLNQYLTNSSIKGIMILAAQLFYAVSCFGGNWVERILWGLSFPVIASISERFAFRFAELADLIHFSRMSDALVPGAERDYMVLIYLMVCCIITFLVTKIRLRRFWLSPGLLLLLLVLVGSGIVTLDRFLGIVIILGDLGLDRSVMGEIHSVSFLMMLILLLVVCLMIHMGEIYFDNQQLQERHLMEDYERKQYEMLKSSSVSMREWKHDMKAQMRTVLGLLERDKVPETAEYVKSLYGEIEQEILLADAGDPVLDVVISCGKERAEQLQTRFEHHIVWNSQVDLKGPELSALLSNLLENALEACAKVPVVSERYIRLEIVPFGEMMKIQVENSFDGVLKKQGSRLLTSKGEDGHGIGTERIKRLVERYGGMCSMEPEGKRFLVKILIPVGANKTGGYQNAADQDSNSRK